MAKKVVVKLDLLHDDGDKRKVMKAVFSLLGIDSLAVDTKDMKLTVIGDVDPVDVSGKLRRWRPRIDSVGPAKEEEKKEDPGKPVEELLKAYNPYLTTHYYVCTAEENPVTCAVC